MITGRTKVYALIGRPITHSRSPELYNTWFARHKVDAVYVPLQLAPGAALASVFELGLSGFNLTTPYKLEVLRLLDHLTPAARAIGAVNTVWWDGAWWGDNTDADGLLDSLALPPAGDLGERTIVLGAGGAARAAAWALAGRGVRVLNRTRARADALVNDLPGCVAGDLSDWTTAAKGASLVVNCTTRGAREAIDALDVGVLAPDALWCDLNYWDPDPPGFAACRATGRRTVRGEGMLVGQAVRAFARYTGIRLDPAEVRDDTRALLSPAPVS